MSTKISSNGNLHISSEKDIIFNSDLKMRTVDIDDLVDGTIDDYFETFIKNCTRTEKALPELNVNRKNLINLFSIYVEIGEILDGIKKAVFYGKDTKYKAELYDRIQKIQKIATEISSPLFNEQRYLDDENNLSTTGDVIENIDPRLFHGILGSMTESGELADVILKALNDPESVIDAVNVHEEMNDNNWYYALIHDTLGLSWRQGMVNNTEKLRVRYPEKFSNELAANRNLEEERKALEK